MTTVFDGCVHQWAVDLDEMKALVPEPWQTRLNIKSKIRDPISGTLMPSIPWYHAFWNEDHPDYERGDSDSYTNSDEYRSPERLAETLDERGVDRALLVGHEMRFLPALPSPDYSAALASAYNEVIERDWLSATDRFVAPIIVSTAHPEAAAAEIRKRADVSGFVTVLVYGGGDLPLGHDHLEPIYEASAEAGLPLTVLPSGNPIFRQTAMGIPEHYVTHDTNLVHNHMSNLVNMVFAGVFDRHPSLDVIWAGQGVSWILQTLWRSTRYYRNLNDSSPSLRQEPIEYLNSNCYVTTYPLGVLPDETTSGLFDMVGYENILFGSGYPYWNADALEALPPMGDRERHLVCHENADEVYGLSTPPQ